MITNFITKIPPINAKSSSQGCKNSLVEFEFFGRKGRHAQQHGAVLPARDVGGAVGTFVIADGQVNDLEVEPSRTEEQVEIAEGVKIAEDGAVGRDTVIVALPQHFGAAQRILHRLAEQPREKQTEELVAQQVGKAHGLFFHGVDQGARR